MNELLFTLYVDTKRNIKNAINTGVPGAEFRELCKEWQDIIEIIEDKSPDYKRRYDRLIENQESFTPEQVDFICYQIGNWYLTWKDRLVLDLEQGTHRLGFAKEQLKSIICGDNNG